MKKLKITLLITICFISITAIAQSPSDLIKANQSFNNKDWNKAVELYRNIVIENPYNGNNWFKLGFAESNLKNYKKSINAYKKAVESGNEIATSYYNIACNYAILNDVENANHYLKLAITNGLNNRQNYLSKDEDLKNIRDTKEFKQLNIPNIQEGISRVDGWTKDINYLKHQFELTHYQLHDKYPLTEWNTDFKQLKAIIHKLEDYEIVVELMKIAHKTGAGHSYIIPPFFGKNHFHQIPIELFEFSDGIFIRKTLPKYKSLLGKEIIAINNVSIEELLSKVSTVANPENKIMNRWTSLFYATLPEVLKSFNSAKDLSKTIIHYKEDNGSKKVLTVENQLFSPEIITSRGTPKGWISIDTGVKPLYLSNPEKKFWYKYLNDSKVVYCQVNEIRNDKDKSLKEFGEDLVKFINENEVNSLVLDLRLNNGGNGQLNRDFLVSLIQCKKINKPGKFFTIIGNKTFSAAILLATQLDQFTETIFIGEPTGGRPSHVGDDNQISLPYSGLLASSAKTFWQSPVSYDDRNWIAPEIYIKPSSEQYKKGNDSCLDLLLKMFQ